MKDPFQFKSASRGFIGLFRLDGVSQIVGLSLIAPRQLLFMGRPRWRGRQSVPERKVHEQQSL